IDDYVNNASNNSPAVSERVRTRIESHELKPSVQTAELETVAEKPSASNTVQNKTESTEPMIHVNPASERIGKHIEWYAQRPAYVKQVAERARPYLYHIVNQLSANHLPPELALLPIVESAYQPTAESPKSAAGLWQFIPSTGLDFDLTQTEDYDKRLDIEASTQAAVRYLAMLKRHFNGDWLLALAAYNCGQGRVDDAIEQNRANGLPTDYWSLHLPEETQEYVPRFLALATIFSNPKSYRLKLPLIKNEPYFVKVNVNERFAIDYLANKELSDIAQLAELSPEQFMLLNPGYLKSTIATEEPFSLLLPVDNAKQLNQHLDYVARFLSEETKQTQSEQVEEPKATLSNAPLKARVLVDEKQKALPVAIISSIYETLKPISPLLSLTLTKQTPPRITSQPLLLDSNSSVSISPSA
ncbi:partial membrane-bound lytic murein transglycosylase D, partial [uncultured bacterium]